MRAKRTDVTRTFDVIGPSVCENPTLNSNNNFYPPPPFEAQGTADLLLPVSHASSLRAIAVPPQSGRQSRCLGRGVHVSDGVRCPDHETPPCLALPLARRADGCSLRIVFLILPRFFLSPSLLRLCFRPPCGCGWSRVLLPKDVRSTSPERHPRVWSNFQADDGALLFLASRVVPTSFE